MSTKNKFAVPVAVVLTILGYVFLYFFMSGKVHLAETLFKLKSINLKRYTVTIDLGISESQYSSSAEKEKQLEAVHEILLKRIDDSGGEVEQKSLNANTGVLSYTISGVEFPANVIQFLSQQGKIGFYKTFETSEVIGYLSQVDKALVEIILKQKTDALVTPKQKGSASVGDELFADLLPDSVVKENALEQVRKENFNPLFQLLYPNINNPLSGTSATIGEGPMIGRAMIKDTAQLNAYLSLPEIKQLLPPDLILMWGAFPIDKDRKVMGLYAIQQPYQVAEPPITGAYIKDAYVTSPDDMPQIDFSFDIAGASKWRRITKDASSAFVNGKYTKKCIAIVADNMVYSAPRVQQEITGGKCQITSIENMNEAQNLASIMKIGELPAKVVIKNVSIK